MKRQKRDTVLIRISRTNRDKLRKIKGCGQFNTLSSALDTMIDLQLNKRHNNG